MAQPEGGLLFEIDATSATLDGSPENYLNQDDFWQRAKRARNEDIVFETDPPLETGETVAN